MRVQHLQISFKDPERLSMDLTYQSRGYLLNFLLGAGHGSLKSLNLSLCISHLPIRDLCEINLRVKHDSRTERYSRRTSRASKETGTPPNFGSRDSAHCFSMSNHTGQLSRQRDKQCLLTFIETPTLLLLNDEHPYRVALVNNRHPKKTTVSLLTNAWDVAIFGMANHLFDIDGLSTLCDVSN